MNSSTHEKKLDPDCATAVPQQIKPRSWHASNISSRLNHKLVSASRLARIGNPESPHSNIKLSPLAGQAAPIPPEKPDHTHRARSSNSTARTVGRANAGNRDPASSTTAGPALLPPYKQHCSKARSNSSRYRSNALRGRIVIGFSQRKGMAPICALTIRSTGCSKRRTSFGALEPSPLRYSSIRLRPSSARPTSFGTPTPVVAASAIRSSPMLGKPLPQCGLRSL